MDIRYRIIVSGKNLYKEVEVSPGSKTVTFGTDSDCDVRVRKNLFYEPIRLVFSQEAQGNWNIVCSDNLYIYVDDVRKLMTLPVKHGTELVLKYQQTGSEVLHVQFLIDFDYEHKKYTRRYDISTMREVLIGTGEDNNIIINSIYSGHEKIKLIRNGDEWQMQVLSTTYGVYCNGSFVKGNQRIKSGDFFSVINGSFYYKDGKLYTQGEPGITAKGVNFSDSTTRGNYPKFSRNSRVNIRLNDHKIEVLDPPPIPKKPKNNLFSRLFPSLIMVVISVIMGFAGGMFILFSIASAASGILTAVLGIRDTNKEYKIAHEERIEKYNAYIERKKEELEQARQEELQILQEKYISEQQEMVWLKNFSSRLFDRCPEDEDFLEVRLGIGQVEAKRVIEYKKQERLEIEDDLQNQPRNLSEQYKYIKGAPIVCNFRTANAIGIIGEEKIRYDLLKTIMLDVCARQYHSDVKMFLVAEGKHTEQIYSLRMLPHIWNDVLGVYNIVCDDNSKSVMYEYLYKEFSYRAQNKKNAPHFIIFLYDECGFKSHPVSYFVDTACDIGVTFVFFGKSRAEIGLGCHYLIEGTGGNRAKLIDTSDGKKVKEFDYQVIPDNDIRATAQFLSPVYTEEISLEGALTKSISLFELLHIMTADDIDLKSRWNQSKVYQSMSAPIGVTKNEIVTLDLHDTAHGPHGLVAGTTGAGKSELLQTYIISMATLYHPHEVGFVIIDFKGGGMANQFRNLPHMMGTITNIDGKEIERSLKSIRAELEKRQKLFAEMNVNHIDKYIIKFRNKETTIPLPHLILIVDEFAELKADQPEFMKELISASRIGRSLGVHLILATQKPSGQVDEQIWSNSRFKLCLKVQSQQDSNEVLKSPLAAEIKEPGRAYLQVGNNEIFELFQSAYSGAPEHADDTGMKEFTIYEITKSAKRVPVYQQKKRKDSGESERTQLEALTDYIKDFCVYNDVKKLPDICLPSLDKVIDFPERNMLSEKEHHIVADLGIYDDPDNQAQESYSIDLTEQNVMFIGSAQSGKTNALQTIIRSVVEKYTPEEVNIYILDFASMTLKNFEKLHHVGGVVTTSEDEKLKNLFKLLYMQMERRKEKLLSVGVSSFSAYCEAGNRDLPQILLMIDNMTAVSELYFNDEDLLIDICREGIAVGISVIIANSQTVGIGYKYLSYFEARIVLHCIDEGEYSNVINAFRRKVDDISGRGLIEKEGEILELQIFKSFRGDREIERNKEISGFIEKINQRADKMASVIPYVPEILRLNDFLSDFGALTNREIFSLGLNYDGVEPYKINWLEFNILAVAGKQKKEYFTTYLKRVTNTADFMLYILDDYMGEFEDIANANAVKLYSRDIEDSEEILSDIHAEMERRVAQRNIGGVKTIMEMPVIIIIVQQKEWGRYVSDSLHLSELYRDCVTKYKGLKCSFIFTNIDNERINEFQADEVMKTIIKSQNYLMFDDLQNIKSFDVALTERRRFGKNLQDGEAYLRCEDTLTKIKIPID